MELEIIGRSQSGSIFVKFNNKHYLVNLNGGFAHLIAEENVSGYANVGHLDPQQNSDKTKVERIMADPRRLFSN